MSVYLRSQFLSSAECEAVRQLFPPPQAGHVNGPGGARVLETQRRRSNVSFMKPHPGGLGEEIEQRIRKIAFNLCDRLYHFDVSDMEPLQYAEYNSHDNGGYDWHMDIGTGGANCRKLSISVQLSNPSDYDGGDLEFWGTGTADRDQGKVIAFPSYLLHRVAPVTRGVRRSLVAWAIGATPFR